MDLNSVTLRDPDTKNQIGVDKMTVKRYRFSVWKPVHEGGQGSVNKDAPMDDTYTIYYEKGSSTTIEGSVGISASFQFTKAVAATGGGSLGVGKTTSESKTLSEPYHLRTPQLGDGYIYKSILVVEELHSVDQIVGIRRRMIVPKRGGGFTETEFDRDVPDELDNFMWDNTSHKVVETKNYSQIIVRKKATGDK
jgi:hypothetical protein